MTITQTHKGYEVSFPYHPAKVAALKQIPGAYFRGQDKVWVVPRKCQREIEHLRQRFKPIENNGELSPYEQAITAPEIIQPAPELPELTIPLQLKRQPYPFQERGIAYILQHKKVIVGDQPGLGKTIQSIAAVTAANAFPCLVICPSSLKLNWQKEWMEVAGRRSLILSDRIKSSWHKYLAVGYVDVFIVNYESLKKYFVESINIPEGAALRLNHIAFKETVNLFKSVIIDESHRTKDGSTQQSKFCMGIARGKEYVIELTGTPVVNKPKDLISQLHILGKLGDVVSHLPPSGPKDTGYTRFINRYCGGKNEATNLQELNYRLTSTCFYRREKSEVLTDLPAKVRQVVLVDITNRDEYRRAENEFVQYLKEVKGCTDKEVQKKLRGEVMVKMGILKQISAKGKLDAVREYVDNIRETGEKVVIFCHLKEIARNLKEIYPRAVSITGDDDNETREANKQQFQTNPNVGEIICSLQAAGVGHTLTAASWVGFVEFPWTFALCEQAEDRCHRIGQEDSVQCAYFLGQDTIDEYCYKLIQKKKNIAQVVTGSKDDVEEEIIDELLNLFNQR